MADSETRATPRPRIQSALRIADILTAVAQSPSGLTVQQVADLVRVPLQTVYRLLRPLNRASFIRRDNDGRYVLGSGARALTKGFIRQNEHIDFAPHLEALVGSTRESAYVAEWANGEIIVKAAVRGWPLNDLVDVYNGPYRDAHARAAGKLLLAFADPSMRDEYLGKFPLETMTARTITDLKSLDEEFQLIRHQGYAVELGEFRRGACGLAVPIEIGGAGYAMGLSAPTDSFNANFPALLESAKASAGKIKDIVII